MDNEDDDMDDDRFSNTEADCGSDPSDNSSTPVDNARHDQDSICDALDPDDDNDGLNDDAAMSFQKTSEQYDFDGDGIGDNADNDDDDDGSLDVDDAFESASAMFLMGRSWR